MKLRFKNFFIFIVAIMFLFACGQSETAPVNSSSSIKTVDKLFKEFYNRQGGEDSLGYAISDLQVVEGLKIQFLETSVMVFDPLAVPEQRFYFKSLGTNLGYYETPPGRNYPQATDSVIDGYVIYPAFISIYQEFGGERFTGKLISSWTINEPNGYIEQHFENVGFYILIDDPESRPKLLPYGLLACGKSCLIDSEISSGLIASNILQEPFAADALSYGEELLGLHLFGAYQNPEGFDEVIFENAVLMTTNGNNRSIPRPIAKELGYGNQPLVSPLNNPNVTFVLISNGLGHNIPNFFIDYMENTGGANFYGLPISEFSSISDLVFQQCFTNMCLEFHPENEDVSKQIKPSPLGYQYQSEIFSTYNIGQGSQAVIQLPSDSNTDQAVQPQETKVSNQTNITGQLTLWDNKGLISSSESQTIYVTVYDGITPLSGVELIVKYFSDTIPTQVYSFPSTDENGYTEVSLPPILAANGEIIEYQVCPKDASVVILCKNENFVIWGN